MKRQFLVAIRNEQGQLLVLESLDSTPAFPGGLILDSAQPQPKPICALVRAQTGLELGGLHQTSMGKEAGSEVYRFTAHIAGGALLSFPTENRVDVDPPVPGFRSASWIAASLIPKLTGASQHMLELARDLAWTYVRPARP